MGIIKAKAILIWGGMDYESKSITYRVPLSE
jgi:hypothetical protein